MAIKVQFNNFPRPQCQWRGYQRQIKPFVSPWACSAVVAGLCCWCNEDLLRASWQNDALWRVIMMLLMCFRVGVTLANKCGKLLLLVNGRVAAHTWRDYVFAWPVLSCVGICNGFKWSVRRSVPLINPWTWRTVKTASKCALLDKYWYWYCCCCCQTTLSQQA